MAPPHPLCVPHNQMAATPLVTPISPQSEKSLRNILGDNSEVTEHLYPHIGIITQLAAS